MTLRVPGSFHERSQHVRVEVWPRLSRPKRAAETGPRRPAKRHQIETTGMDAHLRTPVTWQPHSHQIDPTRKRAARVGYLLSTARTADYPFDGRAIKGEYALPDQRAAPALRPLARLPAAPSVPRDGVRPPAVPSQRPCPRGRAARDGGRAAWYGSMLLSRPLDRRDRRATMITAIAVTVDIVARRGAASMSKRPTQHVLHKPWWIRQWLLLRRRRLVENYSKQPEEGIIGILNIKKMMKKII